MSLGGKQTSEVQIPDWLESAAQDAIGRATAGADIGYMPYMGPDVAAFTPMQEAAFANTNSAAQALGLATAGTGMPQAQSYGGMMGYSSYPIYQGAVDAFAQERPGQAAAYNDLFIDPYGVPSSPAPAVSQPVPQPVAGVDYVPGQAPSGNTGSQRDYRRGHNPAPSGSAGYTSLRDMIDGGGPGSEGGQFAGGGLLSRAANRVWGR